jgi:hypothetical protein
MKHFFSSALIAFGLFASTSVCSQFSFEEVQCQGNGDVLYARVYTTTFTLSNGKEATVNTNAHCESVNPSGCNVWAYANVCGNTGIGCIENLCYDAELTSSDKFSIDGYTYKKNDYTHSTSSMSKSRQNSICSIYGRSTEGTGSVTIIQGFPEPKSC